MNYLKKIIQSILITISTFILLLLITTLFSYLGIFKGTIITVSNLLIPIISIFIGSCYLGINSNCKGWLEGLKLSIIITLILILFNVIIYKSFVLNKLIYYSIFLVVGIMGGSFGISKNKTIDKKST